MGRWDLEPIRRKARILREARRFFDERGFVEVDTAILQPALVPEFHIDSFALPEGYLLPSPELAMKALLCCMAQSVSPFSIYQFAHCFRREETEAKLHRQEFLMLEFYALQTTAMQLLELVEALLQTIAPFLGKFWAELLSQGIRRLSLDQITEQAFGLEFSAYWDSGLMSELYAQVSQKTEIPELSRDDLFHLFVVEFVEPYIEQNFPCCALYPYPDVTPLPVRRLDNRRGWADRWELYVLGKELANACCEENRPKYLQEYRERFIRELCMAGREKELARFDFAALELWEQLPDCSGAALGLDRLLWL